MSELCVDCLNKLMGTKDSAREYIVSRELDLCEECGEWKPAVIAMKKRYILLEGLAELRENWRRR